MLKTKPVHINHKKGGKAKTKLLKHPLYEQTTKQEHFPKKSSGHTLF